MMNPTQPGKADKTGLRRDFSLAPGARVLIRGEEWLVNRIDRMASGHRVVHVTGLSELVRGKPFMFSNAPGLDVFLELRPEDTELVADDSAMHRKTRLHLDALVRRTPPTDPGVRLAHKGAMRETEYQLRPAEKALEGLQARILIADAVGLGKTVEVGILLTELILRGRGERILVVARQSILGQFQRDLWSRFAIPLVRLDSAGISRVQDQIPTNKTPFEHYPRVIISLDTLKNEGRYRHHLEHTRWDVVVIDECQNVTNTGTLNYKLASLLARQSDNLVFTSATPHNGRPQAFASLVRMLDPTAVKDESDYEAEEVRHLIIRRAKADVEAEVGDEFRDREIKTPDAPASDAEEAFFEAIAGRTFRTLDGRRKGDALFRSTLIKSFLSSPVACSKTITARLKRMDKEMGKSGWVGDRRAAEEDMVALHQLRTLCDAVNPDSFSRYRLLQDELRTLDVTGKRRGPRVVIFTERLDTMDFLFDRLQEDLGVPEEALCKFHGSLNDIDQQEILQDFGAGDSKIRVLLASDVASEGVNLHHHCSRLIHFDVPWSLIRLEQRNGRIDRFGQHETPQIRYLLTRSRVEEIRDDVNILLALADKEHQARRNLGSADGILGIFSVDGEERHIREAMERGAAPDEALTPSGAEAVERADFSAFFEEDIAEGSVGPLRETKPLLRLLPDDLQYVKLGFEWLRRERDTEIPALHLDEDRRYIEFVPPPDLETRLEQVPREAIQREELGRGKRGRKLLRLSADRSEVLHAIEVAQERKEAWPKLHLLWERHPALEWLTDRLLVMFGRSTAPVAALSTVGAGDAVFVFQAVLSNQLGRPLFVDWFGIPVHGGERQNGLELEDLIDLWGWDREHPNPGAVPDARLAALGTLVPEAVKGARAWMEERKAEELRRVAPVWANERHRLEEWFIARKEAIREKHSGKAYRAGRSLTEVENNRIDGETAEVRRTYEFHTRERERALTPERTPYLRLVAVFAGPGVGGEVR